MRKTHTFQLASSSRPIHYDHFAHSRFLSYYNLVKHSLFIGQDVMCMSTPRPLRYHENKKNKITYNIGVSERSSIVFHFRTTSVTAALLSKSRKTLHRPVRFSGFKSVRILCLCS